MKKVGLIITAAAVVLFMVGCAKQAPTVGGPTYHSKLGTMSSTNDTGK
jgi:hypothetical protein